MNLNEEHLIKATAKVIIAELRMKEGGATPALIEELEVSKGAVETIKELLSLTGRSVRDDQIEQQAVRMVIQKTGRTPMEIAGILASDMRRPIEFIDNKLTAIKTPQIGAPVGSLWDKACGDFLFFCSTVLEIVYRPGLNKDFPLGGYGTFVVNDHQIKVCAQLIDMWLKGVPVRIILLKARQLGMTTVILAFWVWMMVQTDDFTVFFMIDKDPHMYEKRDMILRWFEKIAEKFPEAPTVIAKGGKRIVLSNRAKILFESAHSPNPGTSEMVHAIHLSEKPKWPKGRAKLVDKSLLPGMPSAPNTFIVDESTAQGMGEFYKKWHRVMAHEEDGDTKTLPVFLAWFLSSEYRADPPKESFDENGDFIFLNEDQEVCETDEFGQISLTEEDYRALYNLTIEQIYWRRSRIKNEYKGVRTDFDQEYPTTPAHAWSAFGRLFFGSQCANEAKLNIQDPIFVGNLIDLNGNNDTSRLFSWTKYSPGVDPDRTGILRIYERPPHDERCYIGGDTAEGIQVERDGKDDPDYSVLIVTGDDGRLLAVLKGRIKPEDLAWHAILLAVMFNNATVNIERNSVGEAVWVMFKQSGYNRVYVREGNGPYEDRAWNKTTAANRKPMLIEMRHHLRRFPEHVRDPAFAHEVAHFITNPDGKPEAMPGEHDDVVMAYSQAWKMIYDITGIKIIVKEPEPEPLHDREFFNVLDWNGIELEEPQELDNEFVLTDLF